MLCGSANAEIPAKINLLRPFYSFTSVSCVICPEVRNSLIFLTSDLRIVSVAFCAEIPKVIMNRSKANFFIEQFLLVKCTTYVGCGSINIAFKAITNG